MSVVNDFLASGILEMYVMGNTSDEENAQVEEMAAIYDEVKNELASIEHTLYEYAQQHAIAPDPTIKPFLMATIDYMDRLENGETPAFPPLLVADSKIEDYAEWLDNEDFALRGPLHEVHAKIIGYTPQMTTAIVWLEHGAPPEIHTNEVEKFLIVEGTCNIIVENQDNHLSPGDIFSIPLHLNHKVIVTSNHPCKIVLQRIAA
jgi:mannose-6-phosphate isomerase-like protein (cupin superfamily)